MEHLFSIIRDMEDMLEPDHKLFALIRTVRTETEEASELTEYDLDSIAAASKEENQPNTGSKKEP